MPSTGGQGDAEEPVKETEQEQQGEVEKTRL